VNYTEEDLLAFIDRHDEHEDYYRRKLAELQAETKGSDRA